jgi:guanyl-specific ribonuclease Sa
MGDTLIGFDKEARQHINTLLAMGWTGRLSSKGHWIGRSPDESRTTISISRNLNGRGRTGANVRSDIARWMRDHAPQVETLMQKAEDAYRDGDAIAADILINKAAIVAADTIAGNAMLEAASEAIDVEEISTWKSLVSEKPWLARKNPSKEGGVFYESAAVIERTWSDGTVDYRCPFGDFEGDNPRSVSAHYRKHTMAGDGTPREEAASKVIPGIDYTEPVNHREYQPTDRLVDALAEWMGSPDNFTDARQLAIAFLTWAHDRPDIEHVERDHAPLTDTDIIGRIRLLVGQPLVSEVEALRARIAELEACLSRTIGERDENAATLVRVQRDLDSVRELLGEIGKGK